MRGIMQCKQEKEQSRLITVLDRGRYIGTTHEGILKELLFREGGINSERQEGFIVIILDKDNYVISSKLISIGDASAVMVSVRDAFREVVSHERWTKMIVSHNHPDGNPSPSQADRSLTDSIKLGGKLLGIDVVDHIVVGDDSFYSFTEGKTFPVYGNVIPFKQTEPQPMSQLARPVVVPVVQAKQRPPKPQDGYGMTWHWSEADWIWYSVADTSTLLGRFYKKLRGW